MPCKRFFAILLSLLILLCGCTPASSQDKLPELLVCLPLHGDAEQIALVNDAMNSYLAQQLGLRVKLMPYELQSMMRRINTKQQLDLTYCGNLSQIQLMQSSGMLVPLDALLEQNGQEILSAIPAEYYDFSRISGSLYAMPTNKERFRINVFEYNKDIADQYGLDLSGVQGLDDLSAVFADLQAKTGEVSPIALVPYYLYFDQVDTLGDHLGVLTAQSGTTVVNLYETAQFCDFIRLIRQWQQAGYLYPNSEESDTILYYLRSGKVLGCITTGKPGFAVQERRLSGCNIDSVDLGPAYFSDDTLTRAWYAIPSTAKNPSLSMKLMELLYSDPYLADLLLYGIEGSHYQLNGENQVIRRENSGYYGVNGWAYCNAYCAHTEQGQSKSYWQDIEDLNRAAAVSPAWGFSFDSSAVSEERYRCEEVVNQYLNLLYSGALEPEPLLQEFQAELRAAGIERIITEKQRQLDAYIEVTQHE